MPKVAKDSPARLTLDGGIRHRVVRQLCRPPKRPLQQPQGYSPPPQPREAWPTTHQGLLTPTMELKGSARCHVPYET